MKTIACLAALAALSSAGAASAQEVRIPYGDLDLGSGAGAAAFESRVDRAAQRLCRDARAPGSRISDRTYCLDAARQEAFARLPDAKRAEHARARQRLDY